MDGDSLWCGYAVTGHSERFFFAGDAAYAPIYNQIGQRYGPFDLGRVLKCNSETFYTDRWVLECFR